jgi:hypothetical protein
MRSDFINISAQQCSCVEFLTEPEIDFNFNIKHTLHQAWLWHSATACTHNSLHLCCVYSSVLKILCSIKKYETFLKLYIYSEFQDVKTSLNNSNLHYIQKNYIYETKTFRSAKYISRNCISLSERNSKPFSYCYIYVGVMDVRPLVKQRQGWEDNVEKNIIEIVCSNVTWNHASWNEAQLRAVTNMVMKIPVS